MISQCDTRHSAAWRILGKQDLWTNVKTVGWEVEQDRMCIEAPLCKDV